MTNSFEETYPNIAAWVKDYGWIEIGETDFSRSFVRLMDIGGMIWESTSRYESLDDALREMESEIAKWMRENQ